MIFWERPVLTSKPQKSHLHLWNLKIGIPACPDFASGFPREQNKTFRNHVPLWSLCQAMSNSYFVPKIGVPLGTAKVRFGVLQPLGWGQSSQMTNGKLRKTGKTTHVSGIGIILEHLNLIVTSCFGLVYTVYLTPVTFQAVGFQLMRAWTHDSNRSECLLNNITWPSLTHHCIEKMVLDTYIYIYIKTYQTIWWGPIVWVTRDRDQLETSCPRHRNRDGRWKLWNQSAIKWDGFDPLSLQHICEAGETQPRWTATHHAMEVAWTESHADLSQPWFVGPNLIPFQGVWKISRVSKTS